MAEIKPFLAYKFENKGLLNDKQHLPFQKYNYQNQEFSFFTKLLKDNSILEDRLPGVYVYYQYYLIQGQPVCTKGFICTLKVTDWNENQVFRHEKIDPLGVQFHYTLTKETGVLISPIHGLYQYSSDHLNKYMDESIQNPFFDFTDTEGTRHVLSVIHDKNVIGEFIKSMKSVNIILADGHHRYTAALQIRQESKKEIFISAFLTNTCKNSVNVFPYYVLLTLKKEEKESFFSKFISKFFEVTNCSHPPAAGKLPEGSFGMITRKGSYILKLKAELENLNQPDIENTMHIPIYLLSEVSKNIAYLPDFVSGLNTIRQDRADLLIFSNGYTLENIIATSLAGEILPEKSTYFFPKILNGLIMQKIHSENAGPAPLCF